MRFFRMSGILLLLALCSTLSLAATPSLMNYQGRLTIPAGTPVADGSYSVVFTIYDAAIGGTSKWSETQTVATAGGLFAVFLGEFNPIKDTVFNGNARYLGIRVGADAELSPRVLFASTPYAYRASYADSTSTKYANYWSLSGYGISVLRPADYYGIAAYGAMCIGDSALTHVNLGFQGQTGRTPFSRVHATVGGGAGNMASHDYCTVAGGRLNLADSTGAAVTGGAFNHAIGDYAFVGGGYANEVTARASGICSGFSNKVYDVNCFIGGGCANHVLKEESSILGGCNNTVNALYSSILGGGNNISQGYGGVILGGVWDTVESSFGIVYGQNIYLDKPYTVMFFEGTKYGSFAVNRDSRDGSIDYPIHVGTNTSNGNGAYLTAGGTWTNGSSRSFKENLQQVDGQMLLDRVATMPVLSWTYRNSTERHIGPVSEDFVMAFDVGTVRPSDGQRDDKYLSPSDVAGVSLAAVKELIKQNSELKKRVDSLAAELVILKANR